MPEPISEVKLAIETSVEVSWKPVVAVADNALTVTLADNESAPDVVLAAGDSVTIACPELFVSAVLALRTAKLSAVLKVTT